MTGLNVIFKNPSTEDPEKILDSEWVKSTFVITDRDFNTNQDTEYEKWIKKNRYATSADHKYTSTSPGMNISVNPPAQYTRYADIRSKGRDLTRPTMTVGVTSHPTGLGMGGYYSMAHDDNQQRIFLRFGVPKYTPLLVWIARSFDIDKTVLQGRGTITSSFITAIGAVTTFFAVVSAPLLALGMFALSVYVDSTRFCSLKDTMYVYWATVENILNSLVARRTMLPYILKDYTYKLNNTVGNEERISQQFVSSLSEFIPDIVNAETGRISVFAIALRAQATYNAIRKAEFDATRGKTIATITAADIGVTENLPISQTTNPAGGFIDRLFRAAYSLLIDGNKDEEVQGLDENSTTVKSTLAFDPAHTDENGQPLNISLDSNDPNSGVDGAIQTNVNKKAATFDKYKEYMLAELTEGAAFAVFNVENPGSTGESFSSSFGSNPIEATFNAVSAKARNLTSLLSSATDVPVVGDIMKLAADAGAKLLSSSTLGIANPLLALAYGVNVSMPKIWESSSAELSKANYKIKLRSVYGNAYSQLFNIFLPVSMLLAGSIPRTTGNSTYTSPFFCQLFHKGYNSYQLAMISQLSITRGTSNLPFNRAGHANAFDIDLAITNLDEVVSVDVTSTGVLTNAIKAVTDTLMLRTSDTPFTSYMNTLASVDVYNQIYRTPMVRLKLAERYMNLKAAINPDPAAFAAMTVNSVPFGSLARDILGDNAAALAALNNY